MEQLIKVLKVATHTFWLLLEIIFGENFRDFEDENLKKIRLKQP